MSIWGRRERNTDSITEAADAELAQRARAALVATDERIRATSDELGFATAELGEGATAELRVGLDAVRTHLVEAFQLHQLCHDHLPDTPDELRTRYARILQLCEWAESVLDERTSALKAQVAQARRAPEVMQRLRTEAETLRARVPESRATLERLGARYLPSALQRVVTAADEAEQLLDFALQSADLSKRRRSAGRGDDANVALETATESVRRAVAVLDAVDSFEFEAMRTQATLRDVVEDSRGDLHAARAAKRTPQVDAAITSLESALAGVGGAGLRDPFAELAQLSAANAALDAARERASKPIPTLEHVRNDVASADRAIAVATTLISGHRGWIGADARTRLAEAQRLRSEIDGLSEAEDVREQRQQIARRIRALADEAVAHAQRDIDASRPMPVVGSGTNWGTGAHTPAPTQASTPQRSGASSLLGPVIGGVLLGALIDNIFD